MSESAGSPMKSRPPHELFSPNARRLKKHSHLLLPHELYGIHARWERNSTAGILLPHELYGVDARMERENGQDNSEDHSINGSQRNTPVKKQLSESLKDHPSKSNEAILLPHELFHRQNRTEKSIPHQSQSMGQESAHDSSEESDAPSRPKSPKKKRKLFCFCFCF